MTVALGKLFHDKTARRFLRFVLVGLLNTIFGYAVYAALVLLGMSPQPALVLAFSLGVIWNYFTTARFVFGQRGFRRLPTYILCYLIIYGLNAGALHMALRAGISALVAQAVLTPFAAILAFILISYALTGSVLAEKSGPRNSETPSK